MVMSLDLLQTVFRLCSDRVQTVSEFVVNVPLSTTTRESDDDWFPAVVHGSDRECQTVYVRDDSIGHRPMGKVHETDFSPNEWYEHDDLLPVRNVATVNVAVKTDGDALEVSRETGPLHLLTGKDTTYLMDIPLVQHVESETFPLSLHETSQSLPDHFGPVTISSRDSVLGHDRTSWGWGLDPIPLLGDSS